MSGRLKPYKLIILMVLIAAFLVGPPLAFASKLPTVCNIFQGKKGAKSGSCGHNVTFSKDKFHLSDMIFSVGVDPEANVTALAPINHHSSFFSFTIIPNSMPLRC